MPEGHRAEQKYKKKEHKKEREREERGCGRLCSLLKRETEALKRKEEKKIDCPVGDASLVRWLLGLF